MDYAERKARLPFGSLSVVARETGVSPSYVSDVVRRGRGSDKVLRAVAAVIGEPVETVFPDARIVDLDAMRAKIRRAVRKSGRAA